MQKHKDSAGGGGGGGAKLISVFITDRNSQILNYFVLDNLNKRGNYSLTCKSHP